MFGGHIIKKSYTYEEIDDSGCDKRVTLTWCVPFFQTETVLDIYLSHFLKT